jgi:hypothetical protein
LLYKQHKKEWEKPSDLPLEIRVGVRDINNIDSESQIMINILKETGFSFFINPIKPDFFPMKSLY